MAVGQGKQLVALMYAVQPGRIPRELCEMSNADIDRSEDERLIEETYLVKSADR